MDRFEVIDRVLLEDGIHIQDNDGNILIEDADTEDISRLDDYAKKIVDCKINKKSGWGHIEDNIEEFVNSLETGDYIKAESRSDGRALALLKETDLVEQWGSETYYVSGDEDYLDLFVEQFESITSFGYKRPELRGILLALSENGKAPSQSKLRERSDTPSEQPFNKQFGDLSRAAASAGLENYSENLDKELLEHKLRGKFYRENKVPSARDINEDSDMPSGRTYRIDKYFGSLSAAKEAAGLGNEAKIKNSSDQGDKYYVDE